MSHGITKCKLCHTVIRQCRCMDHHDLTWSVCAACNARNDRREPNHPEARTHAELVIEVTELRRKLAEVRAWITEYTGGDIRPWQTSLEALIKIVGEP